MCTRSPAPLHTWLEGRDTFSEKGLGKGQHLKKHGHSSLSFSDTKSRMDFVSGNAAYHCYRETSPNREHIKLQDKL